ncbi:hypothetical protein NQZ68_026876 [Dissostichus eleginoides]|nr:hypothetical protein NQZ68_026876 [Dissostichus eleginoides]
MAVNIVILIFNSKGIILLFLIMVPRRNILFLRGRVPGVNAHHHVGGPFKFPLTEAVSHGHEIMKRQEHSGAAG